MPTSQTLNDLGDMKVSNLIGDDVAIDKEGNVTGTLKYVSAWEAFNPGDANEQKGFYLPLKLDSKYQGKKITVTGTKATTAEDLDWVLFMGADEATAKSATFTFKEENQDVPFQTVKAAEATYSGAPVAAAAALKQKKAVTTTKKKSTKTVQE